VNQVTASVVSLPSVAPKQARSREKRAALIKYGVGLLERCEPDEFSIAEITGELGYSTGSFYSYFRDKTAYFIAIQEWVNSELDDRFQAVFHTPDFINKTVPERLETCVEFVLDYFRRRTGAIRSALRYERRIPEGWAPNRARTREIVDAATVGLKRKDRERLETALQMAFGLMVNTVLHDPGPLRLNDIELGPKVVEALTPYLTTE
jgi:AcrR family transcriptional regulator